MSGLNTYVALMTGISVENVYNCIDTMQNEESAVTIHLPEVVNQENDIMMEEITALEALDCEDLRNIMMEEIDNNNLLEEFDIDFL